MLVGLFALMGMNAFAQEYVYKDNCVYKIEDASANPKTVRFFGLSEKFDVDWDKYTLVIPAQIDNVQAPGTGTATSYKVIGFVSGWFGPQDAGKEWGTQEIEKKVQKIQFDIVAKDAATQTQVFAPIAWNSWTALKEYTVNAVRLCAKVPQMDPSLKYRLVKVDLGGVSNDKDPVAIPEKFADGFNVLETIVLPNDPEDGAAAITIGDLAFNQAKKVNSIDLTNVTTIGAKAFQDAGFTSLTIPATVESIGEGAFWGLEKATAITFSSTKMTTVPANIWSKLTAVTSVTVNSETIASIEKYAFSSATAIETINLDAATGLTSIGEGAFAVAPYKKVLLSGTQLTDMGGIDLSKAIGSYSGTPAVLTKGSLNEIKFPAGMTATVPALTGCADLATISIPATVAGITSFKDCQSLETVDLSACTFKTIPVSAFEMTQKVAAVDKAFKNGVQQYVTKLKTVGLPGSITTINANAFKNCSLLEDANIDGLTKLEGTLGAYAFYGTSIDDAALGGATEQKDGKYLFTGIGAYAFAQNYNLATATIPAGIKSIGNNAFELVNESTDGKFYGVLENLTFNNLAALETTTTDPGIGAYAFNGGIFTSLNLKDAPKLTVIRPYAFANNPALETVVLPAQINSIEPQAFLYATSLSSINLYQTDIEVLNNLFTPDGSKVDETKALEALETLVLVKDKATTIKVNDTETRALKDLKTVAEYALQFTGIKKIVIPSTVSAFGVDTKGTGNTKDDESGTAATSPECDNGRVFEGCTKLEEFEWTNVDPTITSLPQYCFLGNTALKKVTFLTTSTAAVVKDAEVFYLCSDVEVYLTADSYNATVADGYGNDNRQYSVLKIQGNKVFAFSAKGLASDGYYYATYCNQENSSWFDASKFDVFTAVIEGSKVVLKKASVDGGYYKVAKATGAATDPTALCIVRSKDITAIPELNSNGGNMKVSTLSSANELIYNVSDQTASKLKYQFKLGNKSGQVAFWRVTSGTIKKGVIYVEGTAPAGRMDFVVEGEGEVTGIENIFVTEEDNAPVYNLQGTQVKAAKKGMYIKNGQKFIVK